MARILIAGVTGFIGSHLARKLCDIGHEVYGVARISSSRDTTSLQPFLKDVKFSTADVSDYYSISKTIKKVNPDVIVNLAAVSSIPESLDKPFVSLNTDVIGQVNIAYALMELPDYKEKRIIYASAGSVYGEQKVQPVKEDALLNPRNPYALNKATNEIYMKMLSNIYGIKSIVMRPANTYGRKLDTSFFVEYIVTNMIAGNKIYLGIPDAIRDYLYVDDHVEAYVKAIEHSEINGETFNIGSGVGTSNKDVVLKIADLIGFDKHKIFLGKYPPGYSFRPTAADQPQMILDNTKISAMLGWKLQYGLDAGLKRTVEYWKSKINH